MLNKDAILTKKIKIGDLTVNRMGLGTNRVTDTIEAEKVLKHAIKIGIHFIDTADIYTGGASESMIGKTYSPYPPNIIIATKGGMTSDFKKFEGRPSYLRKALEGSLKRLKLSQIYLYQLHRIDPEVPLADSVGELKKMQDEGKIRFIGLSEVNVAQIQEAQKIAHIVSVQNEYNLSQRKYETEIDYCQANNKVFIPWFPLERGQISPKKQDLLSALSSKYNVTYQQLALAWLLKRSPIILPIPGTLSVSHLEENLAALNIDLSHDDFNALAS